MACHWQSCTTLEDYAVWINCLESKSVWITASNANKNDGVVIFSTASLNIDAIISYRDSNEVFPVSKVLPLATKGVVLTAKTEFSDEEVLGKFSGAGWTFEP